MNAAFCADQVDQIKKASVSAVWVMIIFIID